MADGAALQPGGAGKEAARLAEAVQANTAPVLHAFTSRR
jgi:hypothetical protein